MARVGIREVAAASGVSIGTVSHYLNHPAKVSVEKASRIQEAMDRLGFVRNNAGRQLRLGHSSTIAYMVPNVGNPFFATIAEGVEQRATEAGLSVFLANSRRDREREDSYLALFEEQGVRGMLIASSRPIESRLAPIRDRGTPSVLVGRRASSPEQPSVSIDDVLGGSLAVGHLIETGRRRIAYVGGPLLVSQVADRLQGASNAVRESPGVTLEVIDIEEHVIAEGRRVAEELLERDASARPDGVFAINDLVAIGMLNVFASHGMRIPEDIAIIGYDDTEYAENSLVPLSSVRPPHEAFGMAAVDLLLAVMPGSETPPPADPRLVFSPELVVRSST